LKNPSRPQSLRRNLAVAIAIVIVVLAVIVSTGAWLLFAQFQNRVVADELHNSVDRLLTAIRRNGDDIFLDTERLDASYKRPFSGHYFVIEFAGQRWRSRSLWDLDLTIPDAAARGHLFKLDGPVKQHLAGVTRQHRRFGNDFVITAAADYRGLSTEIHRALALLAILWGIALIATVAVLNHWFGRALKPVETARRQVAAIQSGERQAVDETGPAELLPFIRQVNVLLAESRRALLRSRNALGNLGHALKTPLAVLSTLVERNEIRQQQELYSALREQIDQIGRRIHRELGQAHTTGGSGLVAEPFQPQRDVPLLITALERAHNRQLAVDCDLPLEPLQLERADMLELLGNIMDNGFKWAKSRMSLTIASNNNRCLITLGDDGTGIVDDDKRRLVLARGQRLDEAAAGQGLGLAIVADIVDAYQGALSLGASPLGGLEVQISLPVP